ncbi:MULTISPECIES: ABC transporter ATP-binding protein [Actinokineospora]|uniref:ABC transporter ATP-binding protein n=1 Tax=Actinokineospora fastidiosa TaxID=1816 RepID=A0A918LCS1_9PSEU|nr:MULTISPECIES: ABC transporter ATP-binding protein [Actinokineospora]UVS79875.1 Lipopolysaccharide export system ATP-binding protein LptB [Actinokineospora sp. UTMC 2448]GGS31443.1 ABC transporter ATP-binding protein [Actinokineospora fastidiosa]
MSILEARGVTVRFGGLTALSDVSVTVEPGTVHGIIGPNGAGKTTLFNVICGFTRPTEGSLLVRGEPLRNHKPHHLARLGIARTLQGLGLFEHSTVLDNVLVGADRHARTGALGALFGRGAREETALRERAVEVLTTLGVEKWANALPGALPYGLRKRVALARALVSEPDLLMLDEPAAGLSESERTELVDLIGGLRESMAVVLVEHHMDLVMTVCDRITVLNFGRVIASGPPAAVQADPDVAEAYLGAAP